MGEYWDEVMRSKLDANVNLRLKEEQLSQVYDIETLGICTAKKNMDLKDGDADKLVYLNFDQCGKMEKGFNENCKKLKQMPNCPSYYGMDGMVFTGKAGLHIFKAKESRMAEAISTYVHANAKGLGKLAAIMANNGELNDLHLMSKETWNDMHSDIKAGTDKNIGMTT